MKRKLLYYGIIAISCWTCTASKQIFNNEIVSHGHILNLDTLAVNLNTLLSQNTVKYGFVIQHALYQTSGVGGLKRTDADTPKTNFALTDRFNPASVTKVISATAVLKILDTKHISIDTSIASFLPSTWTIHSSIRKITFRDILLHRSGINDALAGDDYNGLKQLVQNGIDTSKIGTWLYSNYAFDLCRILIPYLNGYHDAPGDNIDVETMNRFVQYMQDSIFTPLNIQNVQYSPAQKNQTLFYIYPPAMTHGTNFANESPGPCSAGVQLSLNDLSTFLFNLINSNLLLKETQKQAMLKDDLGWDNSQQYFVSSPDTLVRIHSKGGWLTLPSSSQGLEAFMQYYENGLLLVAVYNGQDPHGLENGIDSAYARSWK